MSNILKNPQESSENWWKSCQNCCKSPKIVKNPAKMAENLEKSTQKWQTVWRILKNLLKTGENPVKIAANRRKLFKILSKSSRIFWKLVKILSKLLQIAENCKKILSKWLKIWKNPPKNDKNLLKTGELNHCELNFINSSELIESISRRPEKDNFRFFSNTIVVCNLVTFPATRRWHRLYVT